ncbi:MAG: hypothetical protein N2491_10190 [Negativicutes bacterium]|nr:hypothetical protein [Negativicutes bacterium]
MAKRIFRVRAAWYAFVLHTALILIAYSVADALPEKNPTGFINPAMPATAPLLDKLIRWDAHWYTYIAEFGYTHQAIVFFPLMVIFMKAVSVTGLSYAAAGVIICNIFTLLSFFLMFRVFRLDFSEAVAFRALTAYAVMPTSFFLNSIYTEPIFLSFSLLSIYYARKRRWWPAGIAAAAAALSRNLGVFLVIFLVCEMYASFQRGWRGGWPVLSLGLPPLALSAFMAYNAKLLGDPLAFFHTQKEWGRQFGLPWDNMANNVRLLTSGVVAEPGMILDIFMVLFGLSGLIYLTFKRECRVRVSYLAVAWIWFLIPLFSTTPFFPLYSMSRFVLVLFPLYIFIARLPVAYFIVFTGISAATLVVCAALFMNWHWIG